MLAGETAGVPKSGDGRVEMIRALRGGPPLGGEGPCQAANLLKAISLTAPEVLRRRLRDLRRRSSSPWWTVFASWGARRRGAATRFALTLGGPALPGALRGDRGVGRAARAAGGARPPGLVSLPGVGTHHAATLLVLAGDNPERLRSEASFASLCGVSPVEASSGKVVSHRLNLMWQPGR